MNVVFMNYLLGRGLRTVRFVMFRAGSIGKARAGVGILQVLIEKVQVYCICGPEDLNWTGAGLRGSGGHARKRRTPQAWPWRLRRVIRGHSLDRDLPVRQARSGTLREAHGQEGTPVCGAPRESTTARRHA